MSRHEVHDRDHEEVWFHIDPNEKKNAETAKEVKLKIRRRLTDEGWKWYEPHGLPFKISSINRARV